MNPEIQKWYKALEEADRRAEAGDEQAKEDAYKIADTIRQLEAQAESGQYQANLETPAVLGGVTAIPSVVGGAIRMAQSAMSPNSKGSTTTAPAAGGLTQSDIDLQRAGNIGPGGSGLAKEVTHNVQTAERAEEAAKQKKLMAELQQKGIISEPNIPKIAGTTPGGIAVTDKDALVGYGQTTPPKLTPAQRAAAMLNRAPAAAAEGAKKIPGAVVRGAGNFPGVRVAGGYSIGALGTDAYNYMELAKEAESRGDQEAAAHYKRMAAASAAGSAIAAKGVTSKTPLGRALSIPAAGLTFYNYLQSQKGYPAPGEQESNPEEPVTAYADGGNVPKSKKDVLKSAVRGGLSALKPVDLTKYEGKRLFATPADRTAVDLERGLRGGPMFPAINKDAAWAMDSKHAASRLLNAIEREGGLSDAVVAPMLMASGAHKSNRDIAKMALQRFQENYNKGLFGEPRLQEIQKSVSGIKGLSDFPSLLDPKIADLLENMTFKQRGELVSKLGSKPKTAQALDLEGLLRETTEPSIVGAELGAVGPSLFKLSGERSVNPALHGSYSHILHGAAEGTMPTIPRQFVFRDLEAKAMKELGRPLSDYNYRTSVGIPSQLIDEKLLRSWDELGYLKPKTGGVNNPE